jgi:hypothetical protein
MIQGIVLRIGRSTLLGAWGSQASSDSADGIEHALIVVPFVVLVEPRGRVIAWRELHGQSVMLHNGPFLIRGRSSSFGELLTRIT